MASRVVELWKSMVLVLICLLILTTWSEASAAGAELPGNKEFGSIMNNDTGNIMIALSVPGKTVTPQEYKKAVFVMLDARPGMLAQDVGMPDPVIYRSKVATYEEGEEYKKFAELGTDPFTITIEACRERGIPIVASYRMNSEDGHGKMLDFSEFGRTHKHLRIPGRSCLDPAYKEVYEHRMAIFTEVANSYDIDGIEFNFRRWYHMISHPQQNHPILTEMVAETRQMLDAVAKRKGRKRLLLGVRVAPSVDKRITKSAKDGNCMDYGLDVKTWIKKGYVDYICPSWFTPRFQNQPNTSEFVALVKGTNIGIYPTLSCLPGWLEQERKEKGPIEPDQTQRMMRYKNDFCDEALLMYKDGADGLSTWNWYYTLHLAKLPNQWQKVYGYGMGGAQIQAQMMSILGDPEAIRSYREAPQALPSK